jgi:hypothetical protein
MPRQAVPVPGTEAERWPSGFSPSSQATAMGNAYMGARANTSATTASFSINTNGVYYTRTPAE